MKIHLLKCNRFFIPCLTFGVHFNVGGFYCCICCNIVYTASIFILVNQVFCVNENEIIYSSGILIKNKVALRFGKISNIKIERNLIDIIFGLAKLKLNSGSVVSMGSEIKLSLDHIYAEVLKNYFDYVLKNPQQSITEKFPRPKNIR